MANGNCLWKRSPKAVDHSQVEIQPEMECFMKAVTNLIKVALLVSIQRLEGSHYFVLAAALVLRGLLRQQADHEAFELRGCSVS